MHNMRENSKQWLLDALLELMKEKPYSKITVSEITEKALLSRRTFYRYFEHKNAILDMYADELRHQYTEALLQLPALTAHSVAKVYFDFWYEHIDFLLLLKKNDLLLLLLQKFNSFLPRIHNSMTQFSFTPENEKIIPYYQLYIAGGFWNLLLDWVEHRTTQTKEEMADILAKVIHFHFLD